MAERAATFKLKLYLGEDWYQAFKEYVSGAVDSAAQDITGWTIVATIKAKASDPAVVLTVSASLTAPTVGEYLVTVTAAQSAALTVGTYAMDVWRTNVGAATCLAKGTLQVLQPVRTP